MKYLIVAFSVLLSACANQGGYYQYHGGEPLPPEKKAIVEGHYGYRDGSLSNEMTRIVEINGHDIPREWGVADGANTVSLMPGLYDIKVLYVHGEGQVDYYSYSTISARLSANCTYRIVTRWSSLDKSVLFGMNGRPSTPRVDTDCTAETDLPKDSPKAI